MQVFNAIVQFVILSISSIFFENALFSRVLGTDRIIIITEDLHNTYLFGKILTVITTLGCAISYFLNFFLIDFIYNYSFRPLIYILSLGIIYILAHILLKNKVKDYKKIESFVSVAVFNCAVLGSMLSVSFNFLNLLESLALGFGTGIGYTLAIVMISEGNRKTKNRDVPRSFKGLPLMLIYIGIVSMALYGFKGYQV